MALLGVLIPMLSPPVWSSDGAAGASPADGLDPGEPWLAGPFAADPASLMEAAVAATEPASSAEPTPPAVMLYQDVSFRFDPQGRAVYRRHWVYRILSDGALEDWSVSQVRWSPWYQRRPTLRARVIGTGGSEHLLAPSSVGEAPSAEGPGGLAGQRRVLQARLPAVAVGSVVEELVEIHDTAAAHPGGGALRHYTALFIPVLRGRLVLDAPKTLPLRFGVRAMPGLSPEKTLADDRVRLEFAYRDLPAAGPAEAGTPSHRPRYPHVALSTGWGWPRVTAPLARAVDRTAATARLGGLDLPPASAPLRERVARVLAEVRRALTFDGLPLVATPALTRSPDDVLAEGTGDALDLALVTVAALRRVGVAAKVALVDTGFDADVEPRMPGLGLFDHALVWVPGDEGELWLDVADPFLAPGQLPTAAQGRYALPVDGVTDALRRTPASEPEDNLAFERREVFFADFGRGRVVETCEFFGSAEHSQRRLTGGLDDASRRRGYLAYAKTFHSASDLGALVESPPGEFSGAFQLRLEALGSARVRTDLEEAVVEIPTGELARRLPPVFQRELTLPRREEFVFADPFVNRWRYVLHAPPGFRVTGLPPETEIPLGPGRYRHRFWLDDGVVHGELELDVGQRLLAPTQLVEMHGAVRAFLARPPLEVTFRLDVGAESGSSAFADLRRALQQEPGRASHRLRLSRALLGVGLGAEALRQAHQAVALAPRWGLAHWNLGLVLQHDDLGRPLAPGADLEGALAAFEEARRLAPDDPRIRVDQTRLADYVGAAASTSGAEASAGAADGAGEGDLAAAADAILGTGSVDRRGAALLVRAGRVRNLLGALRRGAGGDGVEARALEVAASTLVDGVEVASAGLPPAEAQRAAVELLAWRRYPAAAELLARTGASLPGLPASQLASVRTYEELDPHPEDPRTPVMGLLVALSRERADRDEVAPWLHSRRLATLADDGLAPFRRPLRRFFPAVAAELPAAARADLALAAFDAVANGAPHLGYRLTLPAEGGGAADRFFLSASAAGLRVVATGGELGVLGEEALERLERGDLPGAKQWLDWARDELAPNDTGRARGDDPLDVEPFALLWPAERSAKEAPDTAELRIAASALAARRDRSGTALAHLLAPAPSVGERRVRGDPEVRALARNRALLTAYRTVGESAELLRHCDVLEGRYDDSPVLLEHRLWALERLGDPRRVDQARTLLAVAPDNVASLRVVAREALEQEDRAAALSALGRLAEVSDAGEDASRWLLATLVAAASGEGGSDDRDRAVARALAFGNDPSAVGALAAHEADSGRPAAALELLHRAADLRAPPMPRDEDGYVLGRIAEATGFRELARDLYTRLAPTGTGSDQESLYRQLARARLSSLVGGF
ncbi:MAG: DUF3857 domain-containing protein [Acidobacteriota bacterium]